MPMDWPTFSVRMVEALVWPLTVVVLAVVLRRYLRTLFAALNKVSWMGVEAEFNQKLQTIEIAADRAQLPSSRDIERLVVGSPEPAADKYWRLANVSPRAAIVEAWRDVELAAEQLGERLKLVNPGESAYRVVEKSVHALTGPTGPDNKWLEVYRELQDLRNRAAHSTRFDLDAKQAYDYSLLASRLAARLRSASK